MSVSCDSVTAHGAATALNGESLDNYFWFIYILIILCLLNVSKIYYHRKVSYQLYAQHKVLLVSVAWDNILSAHGAATDLNGESLGNFFLGFYIFY